MLFAQRVVDAQTLTVSGSPATLRVNVATAGSQPNAVTNSSTTYTAKSRGLFQTAQIVGRINSNMPAGTTLTINLAAVTGATSSGTVTLSTTNQALVTNIWLPFNLSAGITYTFSATTAAGVIPTTTRTVTLTILDEP